MAKVGLVSESLEDYIEVIYNLIKQKKVARVKDIAKAREVRMSSVTGALKRLVNQNLVNYTAREYVDLTEEGYDLARRLEQRHEFIANYLHEFLGVNKETAEADACAIEHHLSIEALDKLVALVEFVHTCSEREKNLIKRFHNPPEIKKNNPSQENPSSPDSEIRGRKGTPFYKPWQRRLRRGWALTLADLEPGKRGRVVRVGSSGAIRQRLLDMGVLPGVLIEVERIAPLGDPIEIKMKDYKLSLRRNEAETIELEPEN